MNAETIGRNALRLWDVMNDGSTWCYNRLRQATKLSDSEFNAAIGWLAREDTVEIICEPGNGEDSYRVRHFWEVASFT